jgi:hypothetical protein
MCLLWAARKYQTKPSRKENEEEKITKENRGIDGLFIGDNNA